MKKIFSLVLITLILAMLSTTAFALASTPDSVPEARGSTFPSATATLPYNMSNSSSISSHTYTSCKFKPTSSRKINTTFYATYGSPIGYDISLATGSNNFVPSTLVFIPSSGGNTSTTWSWSGLNQNTYYAGYMGINSSYKPLSSNAFVRGNYSAG
jgi:hypothetical protein